MSMHTTFSRKIFEGVFWVSAGAVAVRVVGFVTSLFLLRYLSLHEYGTYQLVLAAGSLCALLTLQGIDDVVLAAGTQAVSAGDTGKFRDLTRGYYAFKLVTGIGIWAGIHLFSSLLMRWYSGDIITLVKSYSWIFLLIPFERTILLHFAAHRRFKHASLYVFLQEILKAGLLAFFLLYAGLGISGILWAMIGAMGLTALLFAPSIITQMATDVRAISWKPFFELLRGQGPWVIAQRLLRQGEKNIRPFIIQLLLGREAVALFSLADKVYTYVTGLFPIDDVLMPTIASETHDRERLQRILQRGIKYTVPFYTSVALVIGLLAPTISRIAFPHYEAGIPLLYVMLGYIPFVGVAYLLTAFFISHQEQKHMTVLVAQRFVLFLLLLPVCIKIFGSLGIGIEFVFTLLVYNFLRYRMLQKNHPELHVRMADLWRIDGYDRAVLRRLMQRVAHPFSRT